MSNFCDELLWLEIATSVGPVIFGVFYRPPAQGINNLVALNNCLMSIAQYPVILCGDFNLPSINWSLTFPTVSSPAANLLCDLVRDNYLHQMVVDPTRNQNLLDLVFTNQPDIVEGVQVIDNLPLTDHDAVQFTLNVVIPSQSRCKRLLYNYKKADLSLLCDTLHHVPWNIIEGTDDIEESWQLFKDLFMSAINVSIPRVQWRRKKLKHWFSYQTIHLIRQKRQLYLRIKSFTNPSSVLLLKYRSVSNRVRRLTRLDTTQYTEHICQQYFGNPKKFWSWVNSSKGKCNPIPTLTHNGELVIDDADKANLFNRYFYSVFTQEDLSSFDSLGLFLKHQSSIISSVDFSPTIVCDYLHTLDVSKACGPDLIPAFLLKCCAEVISSPLSYLFNRSMNTGTLPRDWVCANVVPIFKRDDRHISSNYRPISLTSIVVKTMERIIHSKLTTVLESHNLISTHQFGFRRNHSTTHLLLEAVHDWAKVLECRDSCHCLYLDFAKAFDSVPHYRLLLKLQSLGISGQLLRWINCFLTTRSQRVVINGQYSEWLPVASGVPQGSILGPLLFILYVDDVRQVVKHSSIKLFADDISLYSQVSCYDDCLQLQSDLSSIYQWSLRWQLQLNPRKCEAINISNKRSSINIDYYIGSHLVSWSQKVKYLGIIINSKLKWNDHCQYVVSKATKCLNRLRRAMYGCTQAAKISAYKALVRPYFDYACTVWTPYTAHDIDLLESVQHRAARWINSFWDSTALKWSKSSATCIRELRWPSLKVRRNYFSVWLLYSILHKTTSIDFSRYFHFNTLPTRSHPLTLNLVSSTINAFRHSFFVASPLLWNSIPFDILSQPTGNIFKHKLKNFLFCN